jgi:hypothetical protein
MSDIFISYRREGGADLARVIRCKLEERGYRVFLDVDDLRSGAFNTALFKQIDSSTDVLIILTPNCLERCRTEGDWMRQEVARALLRDVNLIPVTTENFQWPSEPLPKEIEKLPLLQSALYSHRFVDASIDALAKMLNSRPPGPLTRIWSKWKLARTPADKEQLGEEDLNDLFKAAIEHWDRLEMIEAKELLERLRRDYPNYRHHDWECTPAQILTQAMPDYRRSVIVVTGACLHSQLNDGPQAVWLKQEIDRRGRAERLETGHIITDKGLLEAAPYRKCAHVAIGGPNVNALTAEFKDRLRTDALVSNQGALIQHDIDGGAKQVALWGRLHEDTLAAVRLFVSSGLLDRFLKMLWRR